MTCPACRKVWALCQCTQFCRECGCVTNHTTRLHEQAARQTCDRCGGDLPDGEPDQMTCTPCLDALRAEDEEPFDGPIWPERHTLWFGPP